MNELQKIASAAVFCTVMFGFVLGYYVRESVEEVPVRIGDQLSDSTVDHLNPGKIRPDGKARGDLLSIQTTPRDVLIHIVKRSEFNKLAQAYYPKSAPDILAWATFDSSGNRICVVTIPEGWWLYAVKGNPSEGGFQYDEDANTLGHELMHCEIGAFHEVEK